MTIKRANRAKLTPKERTAMWAAQQGLCGCGLGNSGKPDKLYRKPCARKKTNGPRGDLTVIAHVKRLAEGRTQHDRRNERGAKLKSNSTLRSAGFDKSLSKKMNGTVVKNGR